MALNATKFSIPFGRVKRQIQTQWFPEVEKSVKKKRKVFAVAYRSDDDWQTCISGSRNALSVITKAKAWQVTGSFLSPKSVYSLHSVASFFVSPNFSNCFSPRKSASVYANYLRSHFSVSHRKTLRSKVRDYFPELRRDTCPEESDSPFCLPFSSTEFTAAATNFSSFTATCPDKVAYSMLKHLSRSGMDYLLHIFNRSWCLRSFPFMWKTSFVIHINKM